MLQTCVFVRLRSALPLGALLPVMTSGNRKTKTRRAGLCKPVFSGCRTNGVGLTRTISHHHMKTEFMSVR